MHSRIQTRLGTRFRRCEEGPRPVVLCDTRVVFRQAPGELDRATRELALTAAERDVVAGAGVGEALWKLPTKSFRVQTVLSDREKAMFNTDQRMDIRSLSS